MDMRLINFKIGPQARNQDLQGSALHPYGNKFFWILSMIFFDSNENSENVFLKRFFIELREWEKKKLPELLDESYENNLQRLQKSRGC